LQLGLHGTSHLMPKNDGEYRADVDEQSYSGNPDTNVRESFEAEFNNAPRTQAPNLQQLH